MGLVWDYYPEGGAELLVALKVADHAEHDGTRVWPAVASLALHTRQSERTVQRALRAMEKKGWLILVKETTGKKGDTRMYRIPVENIPLDVVVRVTNCHPSPVDKLPTTGDTKRKVRVTNAALTGDTAMAHKPSLKATVQQQPPEVTHGAATAARKLIYPPNLSTAQQDTIGTYLKTLSHQTAQLILDELAGILASKSVRDPMAMFAHLVRQNDDGELVPSHAHRVQAEREGQRP